MRYFLHSQCGAAGIEPYAVYGGKVYSFKTKDGTVVPHGSDAYAAALDQFDRDLRFSEILDRRMGRYTP